MLPSMRVEAIPEEAQIFAWIEEVWKPARHPVPLGAGQLRAAPVLGDSHGVAAVA